MDIGICDPDKERQDLDIEQMFWYNRNVGHYPCSPRNDGPISRACCPAFFVFLMPMVECRYPGCCSEVTGCCVPRRDADGTGTDDTRRWRVGERVFLEETPGARRRGPEVKQAAQVANDEDAATDGGDH